MKAHCFVALFRSHKHDALSELIELKTRGAESHAAFLTDAEKLEITEAYVPCVRIRPLAADELPTIDIYEILGMSDDQDDALRAYLAGAVEAHAHYDIEDLFKFYAIPRLILGDKPESPAATAPTFCSMLVMKGLTYGARYPVLQNVEPKDVAPTHLKWSPRLNFICTADKIRDHLV